MDGDADLKSGLIAVKNPFGEARMTREEFLAAVNLLDQTCNFERRQGTLGAVRAAQRMAGEHGGARSRETYS